MSGSDDTTRNYNTRPGVIYLTDPDAALRWAREIANRLGQPQRSRFLL